MYTASPYGTALIASAASSGEETMAQRVTPSPMMRISRLSPWDQASVELICAVASAKDTANAVTGVDSVIGMVDVGLGFMVLFPQHPCCPVPETIERL
jgi:hypothetical protein